MKTVLLAAALAASFGTAHARNQSFDGIAGVIDTDTDGNVEMNGVSVTVRGRVGGWVDLNGASVDVEADVGGDVDLNGASVEFTGSAGGRTEVNAGGTTLDGTFSGPVEVNAGRATLRGVYEGPVEINMGSVRLEGRFAAPVEIRGEGRGGLFRRGDRSRVEVSGPLEQGGRICAHEVEFGWGASVGGELLVIADSPPEFVDGETLEGVRYEPREDERC
ncbi:hypothetical protein DDZ18_05790 [Marinicauda salina]|uniref:Polymer-forming cytoskeletal protein n=1 Tax=Marinicauda salina TaxID=2135793 RepID=A0A2U2BT68_9PROT|nr:hypothetical protein [Marinicauda salina]PWE17204.1 hypothetical protein DDZ18_05790 [Marinicauda salina]